MSYHAEKQITRNKPGMSERIDYLKTLLLRATILVLMVHGGKLSHAQNYEWEFDKHRRREQEKKRELDSLLVHLKNNWQLSLSYGQWYFDHSAKAEEKALLEFPGNMGTWNLSCARFLSEQISVNVNLGIRLKKIQPPRPDIFSVINGAEVDIQGGGMFFMPISVGMDYFFMKQRFRPFTGLSVGIVPASYRYLEASGSISNGINRDELEFKSSSTFFELSSGFVYRAGRNVQLGLNCDYLRSRSFEENIGGYKSYSGVNVSLMFGVVFCKK